MGQSVDSPTSRGGGYVHSVPRPRRMSEVPSGLWPAPACSPLVLLFRHRRRLCLLDLSLTFFEAGAPGAPAGAADSINSAQFPTGTQSKPHAPRRGPIPLAPRRRVPMPPNPGLAPPWAPPPGLSGPHPTAGPRPQPPGPKGRPRPAPSYASRTRDRQNAAPEAAPGVLLQSGPVGSSRSSPSHTSLGLITRCFSALPSHSPSHVGVP